MCTHGLSVDTVMYLYYGSQFNVIKSPDTTYTNINHERIGSLLCVQPTFTLQ